MICTRCGAKNHDYAPTCHACGTPLAQPTYGQPFAQPFAQPAPAFGQPASMADRIVRAFRNPMYIIAIVCFGVFALCQFLGLVEQTDVLEYVFELVENRPVLGLHLLMNYLLPIAAIIFFVGLLMTCVNPRGSGHSAVSGALSLWSGAFLVQFVCSVIEELDSYSPEPGILVGMLVLCAVFALPAIFGSQATKTLRRSCDSGMHRKEQLILASVFCFLLSALMVIQTLNEAAVGLVQDDDTMIMLNDFSLALGSGMLGGFLLYFRSLGGPSRPVMPMYGQPYGQPYMQQPPYGQPYGQQPQQPPYGQNGQRW